MIRTQVVRRGADMAATLMAGAVLLMPASVQAAAPDAIVSGVVRDAQGVGQMGALVQVMTATMVPVGSTFTDVHGRYAFANLVPGRYVVRASAALFVPATRTNLRVQTGATAVVNLTLAALFDTASWLPAQRRRSDEPEDDWKWTLRSTANRPLLRLVEDGDTIEVSSSALEAPAAVRTRARATVESGDGEFGAGGVHNIIAIRRVTDAEGEVSLRADVGAPSAPSTAGQSTAFSAGYEHRVGFAGATRTVASYRVHPEVVTATGSGLEVVEMSSGQRMTLGDTIEFEAGGSLEAVHTDRTGMAAHPFLRMVAHPVEGWTLEYRMATDRELQGYDDLTDGPRDLPVAVASGERLLLEQGRHQELGVARKAGSATLQVAYYHDALGSTLVAGGMGGGAENAKALSVPAGLMVDPTTGSFRALGRGLTTNGVRVTASIPVSAALWVAGEYSVGNGLASETGPDALPAAALAGLHTEQAQSATIAVKGRLVSTGTRLRASYRWQPSRVVTAVDPYGVFSDQAYLSCMLRQPIHLGSHMPQGLYATIDVTNLLAEGYRPFVSADGQTLYFAQSPRTVQAGLSFSF